jgi:PKD repeat protein
MEDVNSVVSYSQQNGCDVTQKIIDDLNYAYSSFETSTAYMRQGGRPVVFFFGTEAYYVDWSKVQASVSGNPVLVFRNAEAFPQAQATGAFSWMNIDTSNPDNQALADLDSLYSTAQLYPSKLTVGGAWKGFNDTLAAWSSNRIINQQCGRTWMATLAETGKYYSLSNQLPYLQLVTWNDYEEGTEIETGVDDCVSLMPSMQSSTLSWSVGPNANENAVSKYRVFTSTDGQNLTARSDVSPGTHSVDLSQFGLQSNTTYTIYVQAIGKATITNHTSPAVTYRPGHQPPSVSVSASPATGTAPVTVTATVDGTSASDSNIASVSVDFGDGSVMNGSPASHQYGNAGIYTITASATDTLGVSSSATTTATITASASYGVAISSPRPGNVNDQFVDVKAAATTPNPPITAMWVYVDNVVKYKSQNQGAIDASLKLDNGPHHIEVQAWDWTGAVFISDVDINVVAPSSTLTAVLDVTPSSAFGQYGVMACTSRTSDTNGFVTSSIIDFGDGTTGNGPTGLHNYSGAGTYNVKATVTDNHGFTSSTSSTVTVNPTPSTSAPTVTSVTPSTGTGSAQSFAFQYSDAGGFGSIGAVAAEINATQTFAGSCSVYYDAVHNGVYLINDAGSSWGGGVVLGGSGTLQNSQCSLAVGSSSATGSGNTLTLRLALSFKSGFSGQKNSYGWAQDNAGATSGWQQVGAWTVTTSTAVNPSTGRPTAVGIYLAL